MIVVRNTFVCKPGNASKLAAMLKEAASVAPVGDARILTDMTGDFNRVILEYVAADFAAFETTMKEYQTNEAFREKMKGYTDLYLTGTRELFKIN